jgi:hypothetical protein
MRLVMGAFIAGIFQRRRFIVMMERRQEYHR